MINAKRFKKGLAVMLAALMAVAMLPMDMKAEAVTTLDITNGSIELDDGRAVQNGNTYYANDFVITGSTDVNASDDYHIIVNSGTHNVTLDNLGLFNYGYHYAARINSGATLNVTLKGINYLCSYNCGVYVAKGATFSVTGTDSDELHTFASYGGAAIGGLYLDDWSPAEGLTDSGTIYIKGGKIIATGGYGAAGIGGANEGANIGGIYISGGIVNATGGKYYSKFSWENGAGIGGGGYEYGGTVAISGGTVTANAPDIYSGGAGIGGGDPYCSHTNITITGGSVLASSANGPALGATPAGSAGSAVYLTTLTVPGAAAGTAVTSLTVKQGDNTLSYGSGSMQTDSNGKLYLYLPANTSVTAIDLTAGGQSYSYSGTVSANNSNVLKLDWPGTLSIVGNDQYTYEDSISFSTSGGPSTGKVTYTYSGTDSLTGQAYSGSLPPSDIGSYTVRATLKDATYNDLTATKDFTITGKDINSLDVSSPGNQTYTGQSIHPDVTIKDGSYKLVKDKDYTLFFEPSINYKDVSTGTTQRPIVIYGEGNYSKVTMTTFCIVPKEITLGLTVLPNDYGHAGDDITLTAAANNVVDMPQGTVQFSLGGNTSTASFTQNIDGSYTASVMFKSVLSNVFDITAQYVQSSLHNYSCSQTAEISDYYVLKRDQTNFKIVNGIGYAISGGAISKTYGDGNFTLQTSGHLSSCDVTFSSSNPSVATVDSSGNIAILKGGKTTIRAVSPEDDFYYQATSVVNLVVNEAGQPDFSITGGDGYTMADGTISKTFGDGDFTLQTAGHLSSCTVTFSSSDPSVASVDGSGKVTILKSGETDITAASPDDGRYSAATSMVKISVSKANQSNFALTGGEDYAIESGTISKTYGDGDFTLQAAGHLSSCGVTFSSSDPSVASVDGSGKVTILKSGETTVTATGPTDDRYLAATAAVIISVSKANQSDFALTGGEDYAIESGTISKTYGDGDFTLQAAGHLSSCGVTFSSSDPSVASVDADGKVTILKSGETDITAASPTDDRYLAAASTVKISVSKAAQPDFSITEGGGYSLLDGMISKTFGDGDFALETSGKLSSCDVTFSSSDPSVALVDADGKVTILKSGETDITAASPTDDRYLAAASTVKISVSKAAQPDFSITEGDGYFLLDGMISKTFGDGDFALETSGKLSSGGIAFSSSNPAVASVDADGKVTILKFGKATITATSVADDRYKEASATAAITVGKAATLTMTVPAASEVAVIGRLSSSTLTGGEGSVAGSFVWTNPDTVVSENGEYEATFIPDDSTDYSPCTCTVPVKVTPVITNSGTGVQYDLSGAGLPDGITSVSVRSSALPETGSGNSAYSIVRSLIGGSVPLASPSAVKIYSLSLIDQNNQVITDFTGKITVRIPIPDGVSGDLRVYWYNDATGTVTDMNARQENGYLVFETTHFSYYAIAELTPDAVQNPDTGGSSNPFPPVILFGSILCGFVIVRETKKYKRNRGR